MPDCVHGDPMPLILMCCKLLFFAIAGNMDDPDDCNLDPSDLDRLKAQGVERACTSSDMNTYRSNAEVCNQ